MTEWTKDEQREHRRLWVEALRSGKYKQARRRLKNPRTGAMCCLGVACEISGLGAFDSSGCYRTPGEVSDDVLPLSVRRWLGLISIDGAYGDLTDDNCLAGLNDSGKRFSTIARIIESEPEGLIE